MQGRMHVMSCGPGKFAEICHHVKSCEIMCAGIGHTQSVKGRLSLH